MKLIVIITVLIGFLNAEPRYALLIGNSHYKYIDNLQNPSYNLERLKKVLEKLGFDVKIEYDLNSEELEDNINKFASRLARYSNSIGFLYYTGHGCQVDYQGYLIPVNVNTRYKLKIKYNALNINKMLETLEGARNSLNMIFLDACRNIPTGAKGGTKGLGQPVARPKGSLIVYATEAGKVANDNSRFINSLIKNISKPNQRIRDIGDNISNDVAKRSGYSQIPEVYTKLLPKMVLRGYIPPTPQPTTISTPKPKITSKWITPKDSVCRANGGEIYKGVCRANWENAKKICSASGGKLPTREDFHKVIRDCGGIPDNWKKNINNSHYQKCYKQKGFSDNWYCWTSEKKDSSNSWFVNFIYGYDNWDGKSYKNYVLCAR